MSEFSLSCEINYNETDRFVHLDFKAGFATPTINREFINSLLEKSNYSCFYVLENGISDAITSSEVIIEKCQKLHTELINKHRNLQLESDVQLPEEDFTEHSPPNISAEELLSSIGDAQLSFEIAQCRDAEIRLGVDDEGTNAYITIEKPFGGRAADGSMIRSALNDKGITHGILDEAIDEVVKKTVCEDVLIAKGTPPKKGKASRFRPLVKEQITTGPTIDDKGRANYHDINEFVIIEPDTPIMERTPPGKGKPGTDIFGRVVPPIPGDVLPFSANLTGATVSSDSNDILISTLKGHPVIEDRGVSISNVLMLRNVGLSTGNVDFDGSVCVEEDVADGVKINVSGDLTVKGVVGKANITAGGNVVILQGLIGGSKEPQGENEAPFGAQIDAKGSVSAHFMTRAKIKAGKHIVVPEYVSHCDLYAQNQILIGQSSGKGNLFGGRAQAFDLIAAKVIGSTGGTPTQIKVGAEGENILNLRRIGKEKRLNDQNTYDINEALHKISLMAKTAGMTPQMKEKVEDLSEKLESLKNELQGLKSREEVIKNILMKSKKSRVVANQKIFNNASVSILGSEMTIKEETRGGSFRFDARRIVFET